jgi:hypothetical protein
MTKNHFTLIIIIVNSNYFVTIITTIADAETITNSPPVAVIKNSVFNYALTNTYSQKLDSQKILKKLLNYSTIIYSDLSIIPTFF